MKNWSILLMLSILMSCSSNENVQSEHEPTVNELIQGSWISNDIDSSMFRRAFSLNFEDSLVYLFSEYNNSLTFKISDSILILMPSGSNRSANIQKIKILEINSQKLKLLLSPVKWKGIRRLLGPNSNDTLELSRITKKNNLTPLKIGFSSTGCFGPCPSMKLEIDQDRNIKFYGGSFTEMEGGYSGKIPKYIYDRILTQIRAIPLNTLKSEYDAPWTDDQTSYLRLEMQDTVISVRSYGDYWQPYELSIVYGNLMDLYKRVKLQEDSTITRFSIQQNLLMSYPIPPPPILE